MGVTLEALAKKLNQAPTASEYRLRAALQSVFSRYEFRFNVPLYGYIADAYCQAVYLIIEVDGSYHVGRERQDQRRDEVFFRNGIYTLRVSAERVMKDINGVLADVEAAIKERRSQMGLPAMEVDKRKYLRTDAEIRPKSLVPPPQTVRPCRRDLKPLFHGDPCAKCGSPVIAQEREGIPERRGRRAFCYIRWLKCSNRNCNVIFYKPQDEVHFIPRIFE